MKCNFVQSTCIRINNQQNEIVHQTDLVWLNWSANLWLKFLKIGTCKMDAREAFWKPSWWTSTWCFELLKMMLALGRNWCEKFGKWWTWQTRTHAHAWLASLVSVRSWLPNTISLNGLILWRKSQHQCCRGDWEEQNSCWILFDLKLPWWRKLAMNIDMSCT